MLSLVFFRGFRGWGGGRTPRVPPVRPRSTAVPPESGKGLLPTLQGVVRLLLLSTIADGERISTSVVSVDQAVR